MSSPQERSALIVLLAHPDDEFAVFPWISRAVHTGRAVYCVWLTDGGWGSQDIPRRRRESIRVLSALGVDPLAMDFLGERCGIPDGQLYLALEKAIEELLLTLGHLLHGSEVLLPAWEGGHQDHDACHLAGLALTRATNTRVRQYPLYQGSRVPGKFFKVLSPLSENGPTELLCTRFAERMGYVALCLQYRSQWRSFLGLLPFYFLKMLGQRAFVLQAVNANRTRDRPHLGPLLYERRGGPTWKQFAAMTHKYRC